MRLNLFSNVLLFILSFTITNPSYAASSNLPSSLVFQEDGGDACGKARGILVLAHGSSNHDHDHGVQNISWHDNPSKSEWDDTILEMVGEASQQIPYPVEVAFGMWDQKNFQEGVTILANQGVCELIVLPLFISDHSDVIRAQKYQFHVTENNPLPFDPGRLTIPSSIQKVIFKSALNDDLHLSTVIANRAEAISKDPSREDLILVAHGPNGDEDDLLWIKDLSIHASRIQTPFHNIHLLTLRDDAPEEIRNRKTKELQDIVKKAVAENRTPLIVPVLLAPGGIEDGLEERLHGLSYILSPKMLAPDAHLIEWIVQQSVSR